MVFTHEPAVLLQLSTAVDADTPSPSHDLAKTLQLFASFGNKPAAAYECYCTKYAAIHPSCMLQCSSAASAASWHAYIERTMKQTSPWRDGNNAESQNGESTRKGMTVSLFPSSSYLIIPCHCTNHDGSIHYCERHCLSIGPRVRLPWSLACFPRIIILADRLCVWVGGLVGVCVSGLTHPARAAYRRLLK